MIVYSRGDLLDSDTEPVVNAVKCVAVVGEGIAAQFKRAYPAMFSAYQQACRRGDMAIGRVLVYKAGNAVGVR